jgi:methionine sulfoxide reductase heme-binding subunit
MNPHTLWYLARASGIVAWLMLTASVLWGVVLATDLFPRRRRAAWLLSMHRWLAGLTIVFIAGHLGALLADRYSHIGALTIVVPFASSWRPTAVAVGVVAVWLLVGVEVTALAAKRLSKKWWRDVHIAGYGVFWAASIHGALAGTDASRALYTVTSIAALAAIVFAASYRVLTRDLPRRGPAVTRRGSSSVPSA